MDLSEVAGHSASRGTSSGDGRAAPSKPRYGESAEAALREALIMELRDSATLVLCFRQARRLPGLPADIYGIAEILLPEGR